MKFSQNVFRSLMAFTLVELLLVVVIMAAAASAAVPNFTKFVHNIEFHKAAEDLVSAVRFGQVRAMTRGRWVRLNADISGYWLEEDRIENDKPVTVLGEPEFQRLKNRHGRLVRWPQGITFKPAQAQILLSPEGSIRTADLEICRRDQCLRITAGRTIGQIDVIDPRETTADASS